MSCNRIIVPTLRVGTQPQTLQRPKTGKHQMGRSRYTITEPNKPHFMTCIIVEWLPVFARPETVQILLDCRQFQRQQTGLKLYGYVILENHLHFIAQSASLNKCVASLKAYTARQIIDHLQDMRSERLLQRLRLAKCAHKQDREFQFWQEGVHAELIYNEAMMREKLDYIHFNPVKRGYVNLPEHWRYSSASNYAGQVGLLEIDLWWMTLERPGRRYHAERGNDKTIKTAKFGKSYTAPT